MPTITPCLWFDDNLEEAAQFYVSIFPNSAVEQMVLSTGRIAYGTFVLDGKRFLGINGGPAFRFAEAVSFEVRCADQAEVDYYWTRLSDSGEESEGGWLKDRFGLSWQIVPERLHELIEGPDQARATAAMAALQNMRKIVIADLEVAVTNR